MELGFVRIEHTCLGNLVQVYNSPKVCSLVINGVVQDAHYGFVVTRFTLKGTMSFEDRVINVQARMGFMYMTLWYDNVRVAKKFMGFG